jgi:hypothetical protein
VKILVVENNAEDLAPHVERYLSVLEAEGYEIVRRTNDLKDGEPCTHPECSHHISHPCEGCGRIGARKA